jgi:type II secretory pathway component PulK
MSTLWRTLKSRIKSSLSLEERGVALMMVLAGMAILSVLVTEFTYVAQVNQKMAYDAADQVKAYYLAKSAMKVSLLRLKAYQNVKTFAASNAAASGLVPQKVLEMIWSFPLAFPLPKDAPGLTPIQKDQIQKFNDETGLEGSFTARVESESGRFNLNSILPGMSLASTSTPTPSPSPSASPVATTAPSPSPTPTFDQAAAHKSLNDYLSALFNNKLQDDEDFSRAYRDFKLDELLDSILGWADRTYDSRQYPRNHPIPIKGAPFYSLSELHQIPYMDETLFELFSPNLTVLSTSGLNVNQMSEPILRALIPQMSKEEVQEFFKFRDDPEKDNQFKKIEEFYDYLKAQVAFFRGSSAEIDDFRGELKKRGVELVVDHQAYRIIVRSNVRQATKNLEAWVQLTPKTNAPAAPNAKPDSGIQILFMRIL